MVLDSFIFSVSYISCLQVSDKTMWHKTDMISFTEGPYNALEARIKLAMYLSGATDGR